MHKTCEILFAVMLGQAEAQLRHRSGCWGDKLDETIPPETACRPILCELAHDWAEEYAVVDDVIPPAVWFKQRLAAYLGVDELPLEHAAEYEDWIASVIEAGKPEEVKRAEEVKAENAKAEEIAAAKRIVKAAEAQDDIPIREEAKRRMRIYNEINNEGGEGYVPHIYSREEYDNALAFLAAQK